MGDARRSTTAKPLGNQPLPAGLAFIESNAVVALPRVEYSAIGQVEVELLRWVSRFESASAVVDAMADIADHWPRRSEDRSGGVVVNIILPPICQNTRQRCHGCHVMRGRDGAVIDHHLLREGHNKG